MSLVVHQPQQPDLAGSGDASGVSLPPAEFKTPVRQKNGERITVSSCIKFNAHTPVNHVTRRRLEEELSHSATSKLPIVKSKVPVFRKETLRRSLTMPELSPNNSRNICCQRQPPVEPIVPKSLLVVSAEEQIAQLQRKEELAKAYSRFIYHLWVMTRNRVMTRQSEIKMLEGQIKQLQMKSDCLKALREQDSERCQEVAALVRQKELELQKLAAELSLHVEDKNNFQQIIQALEQRTDKLQAELEQSNNEFIAYRSRNFALQEQIAKEKENMVKLQIEKDSLLQKASALENAAEQQQVNVERLLALSTELENKLQKQISNVRSMGKFRDEAVERAKFLENRNRELEKELKISRLEENRIKQECLRVQQQISSAKICNMKLALNNSGLKAKLQEVENKLDRLTHKSWKRKALEVMRPTFNILSEMALMLLPALPRDVFTRRCTCEDCSDS